MSNSSSEPRFRSSGLVRDLAELMYRGKSGKPLPVNLDWVEDLAALLVGTAVGKEIKIVNDLGEILANIFVIIVGGSGVSYKTVPLLKVVRPLLKKLTDRINEGFCQERGMSLEDFKNADKKLRDEIKGKKKLTVDQQNRKAIFDSIRDDFVDFSTLTRFTSEKLVSWLIEYPQGAIAGDEYTKMFRGARSKDYLKDNMEDLSRLWDCDPDKVGTVSRGVEYPERAYVSFASATTFYLLTLMDDDFFIQGTGNRILWILDEDRALADIDEEMQGVYQFWWRGEDNDDFQRELTNFAEKLYRVYTLHRRVIDPICWVDGDAAPMLRRFMLEKYNDAVEIYNKNRLNPDANYIVRLAQNAMKLALIHCVGRYALSTEPEIQYLTVTKEDAEWAIYKMNRHFTHYKRMMSLAPALREQTYKIRKNDQDRLLHFIDDFTIKNETPTAARLRSSMGLSEKDFSELAQTMRMNYQIKFVKTGRVYRNKDVIKIVRDVGPDDVEVDDL